MASCSRDRRARASSSSRVGRRPGRRTRFDDAVGAGFRLIATLEANIDQDTRDWFASIGGQVITLGCGDSRLVDADAAYRGWLGDHMAVAVLQRPDFAVFGTAAAPSDITPLLRSLRSEIIAP